jgi:predicted acylesterase/phospholipase RssA
VAQFDDGSRGRTVLVLGGGGALGAYQAGALVALLESGLSPQAVYGCSVGALNGAFVACDPTPARVSELADWWLDPRTRRLLEPPWWSRVRGLVAAAANGGRGLFDARPLRELVAGKVRAHDISELAIPLTVTTTCLECGTAVHHDHGPVGDVLVASCALPGLFAPVRLADRHRHVDGGVLCGVPIEPALRHARPDDQVLVLDCALAPVTGRAGECAALPGATASDAACGLPWLAAGKAYKAPVESHRGVLQVILEAFTVARAVANRSSVGSAIDDPRVHVLPHVADAWAAGLLAELPRGPRDTSAAPALFEAGMGATSRWLASRSLPGCTTGSVASSDERTGERSSDVA